LLFFLEEENAVPRMPGSTPVVSAVAACSFHGYGNYCHTFRLYTIETIYDAFTLLRQSAVRSAESTENSDSPSYAYLSFANTVFIMQRKQSAGRQTDGPPFALLEL
jgi:hypothetical protein